MDNHTILHLTRLHPLIRTEVATIVDSCNKILTGKAKLRITQGLRTLEQQRKLYAIGRTIAGKKVTNAKAGQSIHNYGFAVDICLIVDGKEAIWDIGKDFDDDKIADWMECVKIFKQYGWLWGGDWKTNKDYSHFEKSGFSDWRTLSKLPVNDQGYIILTNEKRP
ncbi:M15 family metallopeptidase [Flavobacterium silvaticum]|uniref:M15 family metallopeptidase n=1 Tax=Flavobacterium silvaticum TaxID=1852020 RepID=A0A972JHY9_9FLAO|nr:M15 family metallopeptidase [Flavobacterium silvaticum]NMH28440.1 M15 family metallopeptidase [Flavobacterium silvaticum]